MLNLVCVFFQRLVGIIAQMITRSPWGDTLLPVIQIFARWFSRSEGLYEVLEYESTLELLDARGEKARFHKRQRVKFLQDHIIAYQDQAWGDGEFLLHYRCTPGVAVDRYRVGHKTIVLISLREVKQRGAFDEFNIERDIRQGFTTSHEQWETEISHPTRKITIQVIFPKKRPPLNVNLVEADRQRFQALGVENKKQLLDGRWEVRWKCTQPRLNERYILRWEW
jgi:hypothetical protein